MIDDDNVPWANPAIRETYEAALGRLILAHNEVDYRLTTVIAGAVERLGGDALAKMTEGAFSRRVGNLEILQALAKELWIGEIDTDRLRALNGERNVLAHGHFDQNPYDGSYTVLRRQGYLKAEQQKVQSYPAKRLDQITKELESLAERLRHAAIAFDFDDLTEEAAPQADTGASPQGAAA